MTTRKVLAKIRENDGSETMIYQYDDAPHAKGKQLAPFCTKCFLSRTMDASGVCAACQDQAERKRASLDAFLERKKAKPEPTRDDDERIRDAQDMKQERQAAFDF